MLTAGEIAGMRDTQDASLPDVCTVTRNGAAHDGLGGTTSTRTTVASGVPCRLGQPTRQELAAHGPRIAELTGWVVTVPAGTDVQGDDRLTVGYRTFHVAANPRQSWATAQRAVCWEVQ